MARSLGALGVSFSLQFWHPRHQREQRQSSLAPAAAVWRQSGCSSVSGSRRSPPGGYWRREPWAWESHGDGLPVRRRPGLTATRTSPWWFSSSRWQAGGRAWWSCTISPPISLRVGTPRTGPGGAAADGPSRTEPRRGLPALAGGSPRGGIAAELQCSGPIHPRAAAAADRLAAGGDLGPVGDWNLDPADGLAEPGCPQTSPLARAATPGGRPYSGRSRSTVRSQVKL